MQEVVMMKLMAYHLTVKNVCHRGALLIFK
jgi:hypothetical protein